MSIFFSILSLHTTSRESIFSEFSKNSVLHKLNKFSSSKNSSCEKFESFTVNDLKVSFVLNRTLLEVLFQILLSLNERNYFNEFVSSQ